LGHLSGTKWLLLTHPSCVKIILHSGLFFTALILRRLFLWLPGEQRLNHLLDHPSYLPGFVSIKGKGSLLLHIGDL